MHCRLCKLNLKTKPKEKRRKKRIHASKKQIMCLKAQKKIQHIRHPDEKKKKLYSFHSVVFPSNGFPKFFQFCPKYVCCFIFSIFLSKTKMFLLQMIKLRFLLKVSHAKKKKIKKMFCVKDQSMKSYFSLSKIKKKNNTVKRSRNSNLWRKCIK